MRGPVSCPHRTVGPGIERNPAKSRHRQKIPNFIQAPPRLIKLVPVELKPRSGQWLARQKTDPEDSEAKRTDGRLPLFDRRQCPASYRGAVGNS